MQNIPKLKIKINDFRAINNADIILNGITVIAGNNGSGKSTISKLLYRTVKTAIDFDKVIADNLFNELRDVSHFLDELSHETEFLFREKSKDEKSAKGEFDFRFRFYSLFEPKNDLNLKEQEKGILEYIDFIKSAFDQLPEEIRKGERYNRRFYRLERYFKEEFFEKEKDSKNIDISVLLYKFKDYIKKKFEYAYNQIENRPIETLNNIIDNYFTEKIEVNNFDIEELGALITNRHERKLSKFLTINKVAYIDTPMIIGVDNIRSNNVLHWKELDSLLKSKGENQNKKNKIESILKNEVIEGETNYDSKRNNFVYKRNDEFSIDLLSCATGLKSFSILQILLNNGFLDNKTLLILDEPEVHLHPEWIVQYARVVVLLHKELGVNFLIGSHSPDMIMAIKYIAKKEFKHDSDILNFYIAKESEKFSFDYEKSSNDIQPIFNSFNISLDKINEYGATSEE